MIGIRKVDPQLPFFGKAYPVREFVLALQHTVGAVPTGVWDRDTHDLTAVWMIVAADRSGRATTGLPPWGVAPDEAAQRVAEILFKLPVVFEAVCGVSVSLGFATCLPALLGLPTLRLVYEAFLLDNDERVRPVMEDVRRHVADVEWEVRPSQIVGQVVPPSVPGDPFAPGPRRRVALATTGDKGLPWWAWAGIGVLSFGIVWATMLRKRKE